MSYGLPWANASNTPFRLFKSWVHEGGISTPFFAHWPNGIKNPGRVHHNPWSMLDIAATCYDISGIQHPSQFNGNKVLPIEGESFASVFKCGGDGSNGEIYEAERKQPIFWEHQGNKAVRCGKWKLVKQHNEDWELFDMDNDRTELKNLASEQPQHVQQMVNYISSCSFLKYHLHQIFVHVI